MPRLKKYLILFILLIPCLYFGQDESWRRPHFGGGAGTFTFIGDVGENNQGFGFTVSDFAYRARISYPVYDFLDASFQFTLGRLTGNERSIGRNLNFQSEVRGGGLNLMYNFDHFLPQKRTLSPYVSVGIQSFEFLSKTDLYDANGFMYHYWSDGTIRNMAEGSPGSASSILLNRDYIYETDLRELNLDGFGNYNERSFSIPIGVGANVPIGQKAHFTIGTELHFTGTDLIDNLSKNGEGERKGNNGNDKFLFTWFSLNYNFDLKKKEITPEEEFEDLLASGDRIDSDDDGIIDLIDQCPNTEAGIEVDEKGCPKDGDKDGVPDHIDEQLDTPKGSVVDEYGVAVDDQFFLDAYMTYIDSGKTGVIERSSVSSMDDPNARKKRIENEEKREYYVQIGTDIEQLDVNLIDQILSIPDVRTKIVGDSTLYVVGRYDNLPSAVKRKINLENEGYEGVVYAEEEGKIIDVSGAAAVIEKEIKEIETEKEIPDFQSIVESSDDLTWRVQIGAFQFPLSSNIFSDVNDLIVLPGEDGITRYMSGSYTNINSAAEHKLDLLLKGFDGAFLTVFRGGNRISIEEATTGRQPTSFERSIQENEMDDVFDASKTYYRIQLASYSSSIPTEQLNKLMKMEDFDTKSVGDESYYVIGSFKTLEEAQNKLSEINLSEFPEAKIVGDFNGKIISAEEAEKILGN
ncbi:MAG: hypothetical protein AAF487_13165 [Bacteroidota bacterium]